jgi:hypothetical protein
VVVTVGAAAGEGVAQPEAAVERDPVGDVENVAVPLSAATTK